MLLNCWHFDHRVLLIFPPSKLVFKTDFKISKMNEKGIVEDYAEKAGLSHRSVLRANELHRLVQSQGCFGPIGALGVSASGLAVICLHLVISWLIINCSVKGLYQPYLMIRLPEGFTMGCKIGNQIRARLKIIFDESLGNGIYWGFNTRQVLDILFVILYPLQPDKWIRVCLDI